ncbi:MAG TPA: carboxylating nicotinate-nucleotide diphosphorylase [Verrucomicrobiae bacterium]|jgi:nicotinate-nucleotide pyrophosphorylase (carboxylating)|nr:carboxylating nicotinate-nucleotide diphosphorylase [Verrucomicrobiae bacterium]
MDIVITAAVEHLIKAALEEDIGPGDITTMSTIDRKATATGLFRAKGNGVVAGLLVIEKVFSFIDPAVRVQCLARDGDVVTKDQVVAEAEGPTRSLLLGERTALNFLQRLSGTATLARQYVEAVKDFPCKIIDTRKTTPGFRTLEKYAVRVGGATNHRLGLYDAALLKDNHIAAAGSIADAVRQVRNHAPFMAKVEVECTNVDQVKEAIKAGADVIMLDNMNIEQMAEAVRVVAKRAGVEASGGITMKTVREVAATGVDFISVGALTHSAPSLDFNMKIQPAVQNKTVKGFKS